MRKSLRKLFIIWLKDWICLSFNWKSKVSFYCEVCRAKQDRTGQDRKVCPVLISAQRPLTKWSMSRSFILWKRPENNQKSMLETDTDSNDGQWDKQLSTNKKRCCVLSPYLFSLYSEMIMRHLEVYKLEDIISTTFDTRMTH